jgi:hypothetical protein
MSTRMALLVLDFTIFLAMSLATAQASRAADDCLLKPNAAAPPGSHWYYRVDRATQRECWYLGAEGAKVRSPARQDASPVQPQSSKISAQPVRQTPAQVTQAAAVEASPADTVFVESSNQAQTSEESVTEPSSMPRAEGAKVRPARQDASPVRSQSSKISAQPMRQKPAQVTQVAAAEVTPAETVFIETPSSRAQTFEESSSAASTIGRFDLPISTVSVRSEPTGNSYATDATEQPATDTEKGNDSPSRLPILSRADLSSAEQSADFPISFVQVGVVLGAAMLGLAAIFGRMIFKLCAKRPSRAHSRDRGGLTASTHRPGKQIPPTIAPVTDRAILARRTVKPSWSASNPEDIEPSVRRLLQELHRRQRAYIPYDIEAARKQRAFTR